MTWKPVTVSVTRWTLRCDGQRGHGQCEQFVLIDPYDDPDARVRLDPRLWSEPVLEADCEAGLRWEGWLVLRDGRVLCPEHVAACEYQVRAALDGLPFSDTNPGCGSASDSAGGVIYPGDQRGGA
jgi:hypothetical protein